MQDKLIYYYFDELIIDVLIYKQVTFEEADSLAKKNGLFFFEVSAKDATNVNKAFEKMIIGFLFSYFHLFFSSFLH